MAKKTKRTKRTKPGKAEPLVTVDSDCQVSLHFTGKLAEDPEIVRRLAHRVVDVMADNGLYDHLEQSVANNLSWVLDSFAVEGVTALIHEAQAAGKARRARPGRTEPSTGKEDARA